MRSLSNSVLNALSARVLVARDFFWITGVNLDTDELESVGFWSDVGNVSAPVIDGLSQVTVTRDFVGSGTLFGLDDIPLVADVSVREIGLQLSQVDPSVELVIRGYAIKGAPVQIHRGLFNPDSRSLAAPAVPRFVGFVDRVRVTTPAEGQAGSIEMTLVSHSRELTRANSEKRSDASQRRRAEGDRFYRYSGVAKDWSIFWGRARGKVHTSWNPDI